MAERTVAAVFFDMDETLIEHTRTMYDIGHGVFEVGREALAEVEEGEFMKVFWAKAGEVWEMMTDGVLGGDVVLPQMFVNTLRAFEADEAFAEPMRMKFEELMVEVTRLRDASVPVLDTLRGAGIATGIITNGFTLLQERKIDYHGLREHVDFVLVSEAVGSHKPDRVIFEEALSRAGVEASQTLFVGDNLDTDIAGAVGAGMGAILIDPDGKNTKRLNENGDLLKPLHIIADLSEVPPLAGLNDAEAVPG